MARKKAQPRQWQNRIVGQDEVDADQLLANPHNWRIHPKAQQDALAGVLDQVGWVQRVIVNKRTGYVIDGHARVAMAISRGEKVPVTYVDLDEDEEKLIIATFDPLGAMAVPDEEILSGLVADIGQVDSSAVEDLIRGEQGIGDADADLPVDVPEVEPGVKVGMTFHPGIWLAKRQEITRVLEQMVKTYECKYKVQE